MFKEIGRVSPRLILCGQFVPTLRREGTNGTGRSFFLRENVRLRPSSTTLGRLRCYRVFPCLYWILVAASVGSQEHCRSISLYVGVWTYLKQWCSWQRNTTKTDRSATLS